MNLSVVLSAAKVAKRLTMGVVILSVISTGIQFGKYVYHAPWARSDWANFLNLDREMNLPTWYSTFMLALSAFLLELIARGKREEQDRFWRRWRLLSWIFWFLAADEILSIHEVLIIPQVAQTLHLPWFLHSMWVIPGMMLVGVFLWKYWPFTRSLPLRSRRHLVMAAGLYIGGALGMEMVGSYVAEWQGQQHLPYALLAMTEEILEMMGIVVFIYGLLSYMSMWNPEINLRIKLSSTP
jgi:hypothetical protein